MKGGLLLLVATVGLAGVGWPARPTVGWLRRLKWLIDQLVYEGFSVEQAIHGVTAVGL